MRRDAGLRRHRHGRPLLHRKRRRRNFHPRRRRRRAVHQHRNPFRLPGPHGAGHPAILPALRRFHEALRFRAASVAGHGRGLRIAGDRRPAAQNRGAFRPAPNRDHPRTATRDRPRKATGHGTGGAAARRHRLGLSGAVRRRPRAVRIARNTGLRRDRQPRPRPEQIHRPGGHGELPEPFRPHLLRLRHDGPTTSSSTTSSTTERRNTTSRSTRCNWPGPRNTPGGCPPGRASAWPCTPRP